MALNEEQLELEAMWMQLELLGVEEQTLQIVTSINGYNEQSMRDILWAHEGYNDFDQLP